jgi:hypothetical protein
MDRLKTRIAVVVLVITGGVALAFAQGRAQFGYLDVRAQDGEVVSLRADDEGRTATVHFDGEGISVSVQLPAHIEAGSQALLTATLRQGAQIESGTLTLNVQESGRFVSGTVHGGLGAWEINGGLRLLAAAAPDGTLRVATRQ